MIFKFSIVLSLVFYSCFGFAKDNIPQGLWTNTKSTYYSPYAVTVDKTNKKLAVWRVDKKPIEKIKEYNSDQGKVNGDKKLSGDKKTPEGIYFFQKRMNGKDVNYELYGIRIFTLDYPNLFDVRDGKTGNGIWLHAVPDTTPLDRGSRGCVVIRNDDILDITENIDLQKTPILIFNKLNLISEKEREKAEIEIKSFIKSWHKSWISKDMDTYITHYSEQFRSLKMSKNQWKRYKTGLNEKYESIHVEFSTPVIYETENKILVRSLQHYRSDQHEDFGEKSIYLKRESGKLAIIAESWAPLEKDVVTTELDIHRFTNRSISSAQH